MTFDPHADTPLKKNDKDAAKLTLEQAEALVNWANVQDYRLFEHLPLSEVLALYHASIEWETFEDWINAEPAVAIAAYNICVSDPSNHLLIR